MLSILLRSSVLRVFLMVATCVYLVPALADDGIRSTPNLQSMIMNLVNQMPNLMRLVTSFAYVMGFYFVFHGMIKLKHFGESRTMMSPEHNLMNPIIYVSIGAALIYFPTTVQIGLSTFWNDPNPYSYDAPQMDQWAQLINACFLIVQFVGTVAFIRGLVILSHTGNRGQPGSFAKGFTHIIGGIFCINIHETVLVILNTLGLSFYNLAG